MIDGGAEQEVGCWNAKVGSQVSHERNELHLNLQIYHVGVAILGIDSGTIRRLFKEF